MLTRLERQEMSLQSDMQERARRLRAAKALKRREVWDGWTATRRTFDDLPEGILDYLCDQEAA